MVKILEIAIPGLNLDNTFDYKTGEITETSAAVGKRAVVSFQYKTYTGIIIKIKENSDYGEENLKSVVSILDETPVITENLLKLANWISEYYICSLNRVLGFMIPSPNPVKSKKFVKLICSPSNEQLIQIRDKFPDYFKALNFIMESPSVSCSVLESRLKGSNPKSALNYLKNKGFIEFAQEIEDASKTVEENKIFFIKQDGFDCGSLSAVQQKIIELVKNHNGEYNTSQIISIIKCSSSPVKTLLGKKILEIRKIKKSYLAQNNYNETEKDFELNQEQITAIAEIEKGIDSDDYCAYLLFGITGSGKTEVYLRTIKKVIECGGECIMLVPEISLTPQTVARFKNRFGEKISVLHSMLSPNERLEQWNNALTGKTKIVVGARSAVFAPFRNLKLIIVDEEHENSYKQSESPPYNGRDAAIYRAYIEKCPVILGSATPTIESYYNAVNGKYKLLELPNRANPDSKIPNVAICDIKNEVGASNNFLFSSELKNKMKEALSKNLQTILFLNRRGFAPLVLCLNCGTAFKCPECNISLTFHYEKRNLVCHYCGYEVFTEGKCPQCGDPSLKFIGLGTEKIEIACKYTFPDSTVERIDADTVRKKNYLSAALEKFKNKEIDILVGTQIVAKGLDFPDVTVIGIIFADITLNLPDFRAAERNFSLITQVAGRAGRSLQKGNVIIQTLSPEHYSIKSAAMQDFKRFYSEEISIRQNYGYPPFVRLINLIFSGEYENKVRYLANIFADKLKSKSLPVKILGPVAAAIPKIKNQYRYQVLIKGTKLAAAKSFIKKFYNENKRQTSKIFIDVDPQSLM
ncbi:MAG TPA: primosomal protein N' [bacterium]|nr:primosomal protein N' [bacterium]HPN30288.1 primosomal protein N' [bacterium]